MVAEPTEVAVVVRIFREFAEGRTQSAVVRALNAEGVPGRVRSKKGWSPATVNRILRNEKYAGRWIWNRTITRRDPKTGRRRQFPKPESEWVIHEDESLRVVPQELWERVQARLSECKRSWPGGKGRGGFQGQRGSPVDLYPTELLSGAMVCGVCGSAIVKASGEAGGYYGCLGAAKGSCESRTLVRRTLAERVILGAVRERLADAESLRYVFEKVEAEVAKLLATAPDDIRQKEAELDAISRKIAHFVEFVGEGRGSKALAEALMLAEKKAEALNEELDALRRAQLGEQRRRGGSAALAAVTASVEGAAPLARLEYSP